MNAPQVDLGPAVTGRPMNRRTARRLTRVLSDSRFRVPTPTANLGLASGRRGASPVPVTSRKAGLLAPLSVPRNRTIIGVDITGFGSRDEHVQDYVRTAMYALLQQGFVDADVPWPTPVWREDRGDGALLTVSSDIPTQWVFDPLVPLICAGLRRHNKVSSEAAQLWLRMAVDAGYVYRDEHGLAGEALVRVARLLDAPAFRQIVASERATLGLVVSPFIYHNVIQPGPGLIDPGRYRRLLMVNKETTTEAWLHLPLRAEVAH